MDHQVRVNKLSYETEKKYLEKGIDELARDSLNQETIIQYPEKEIDELAQDSLNESEDSSFESELNEISETEEFNLSNFNPYFDNEKDNINPNESTKEKENEKISSDNDSEKAEKKSLKNFLNKKFKWTRKSKSLNLYN
jgi:hypothetical protein